MGLPPPRQRAALSTGHSDLGLPLCWPHGTRGRDRWRRSRQPTFPMQGRPGQHEVGHGAVMAVRGGPGLQRTRAGSSGVSTNGLCAPAFLRSEPRSCTRPGTWNLSPQHQDGNVGVVAALRPSRRPNHLQSRLHPAPGPPAVYLLWEEPPALAPALRGRCPGLAPWC